MWVCLIGIIAALGWGNVPSRAETEAPAKSEPKKESSAAEAPSLPAASTTPTFVVPASRKASNLAVLTIEGEINAVTSKSFQRRLKQAIEAGADGIVIDLDTPGGELGAVFEICDAIKQSPVQNTVAWVNPNAYSGGAIIALACKEIVVAPHGTMGDAAPIFGDPLGMGILQGMKPTERAKILSPLLAEVVDSARTNGYDEKLVQAFVTLGVELWLIEEKATGKRYAIDRSEYLAIFGVEPPTGSPIIASGSVSSMPSGDAGGVTPGSTDEEIPLDDTELADATGAPAGASPAEPAIGAGSIEFAPASDALPPSTISEVSATLTSPSRRPVFSGADRARFKPLGFVTDGRALLTMKERELKYLGFARTTIKDDAELQAYMGAQHLRRLNQSWSESLVAFMTQGMSGLIVRGILIVIFLLALFIEISIPGAGIFGVVALLALGGLVVPPMLIGAANWWAGAAIIGGVALIMLEIFVLPGVAVAGILGLLLLMVGLVGLFAETGALFPGQRSGGGEDLAWAGSVVLLAVFVAGVGMYMFSKYTHKFPIAGKLVLATRQPTGDDIGMLEAMNASDPASPVTLGAVGRATTTLRPAGSAVFDDKLVDVVAEYGFINAGETVRVVSVTPYRVGVERAAGMNEGTGPVGGAEMKA
jgi:membrane-bound serine protease (ClpP class)